MDAGLVFDVGMHEGEDTAYYLGMGYRVVAVDADPTLVERAAVLFAEPVSDGRLVLVHCAVASRDGTVEFHISSATIWSSLVKRISNRHNLYARSLHVPARRLDRLFVEHGVPLYCKIDVEGYDPACLATLCAASELPLFLSVETECVGEGERLTDWQALDTLRRLKRLGYDRFKLVDQRTLTVVEPRLPELPARITSAPPPRGPQERFQPGSTGPFGNHLEGRWLDYKTAEQLLVSHRRRYFSSPEAISYGFWCDWHATRHV